MSSNGSTCFFFNDTATTEIYTLSLHDALPISGLRAWPSSIQGNGSVWARRSGWSGQGARALARSLVGSSAALRLARPPFRLLVEERAHCLEHRVVAGELAAVAEVEAVVEVGRV